MSPLRSMNTGHSSSPPSSPPLPGVGGRCSTAGEAARRGRGGARADGRRAVRAGRGAAACSLAQWGCRHRLWGDPHASRCAAFALAARRARSRRRQRLPPHLLLRRPATARGYEAASIVYRSHALAQGRSTAVLLDRKRPGKCIHSRSGLKIMADRYREGCARSCPVAERCRPPRRRRDGCRWQVARCRGRSPPHAAESRQTGGQ